VQASSTPEALWGAQPLRLLRPAAIACRDVRRRIRGQAILDGVSLTVPVGARLLVVSLPDAAASMLLRILAGVARMEGGSLEVAGIREQSGDRQARIGYVGREPGIPDWLTPREALEIAVAPLGLRRPDAARAIDTAAARAAIVADELARPIRRGGRSLLERVAFASALIPDPEVLLLDEPLRSLEPTRRAALLHLPERRRTMLLASRHPASEAGICTHVALIRSGRIAVVAPLSRLEEEGLPLSLPGIEALAPRLRA
jgi:ABC-type multidrug transport system ATPase subunit